MTIGETQINKKMYIFSLKNESNSKPVGNI